MSALLNPTEHVKPLKFFLKVNRKELPLLFANMFFYVCGTLSMLVVSYLLGRIVDVLSVGGGTSVTSLLVGLIAFIIGYELFYRSGHICEIKVLSNVRNNTQKALFDHTTSLSFGYFADRFAGELAHKVSQTAGAYERMTILITNGFVENGVLVPLSAIALGTVNIYYAEFILLWTAVFVLGSWFLAKRLSSRANSYAAIEARTTGTIVDVYGNIAAVKVYGQDNDSKKAHTQIDKEKRAYRDLGRWEIIMYNYQGTSIITLSLGLIAITGYLYQHALITVGTIVFVSTAAIRLFGVAWEMGIQISNFIRARGEAVQNLRDLIEVPAVRDGSKVLDVHRKARVEYKKVTFSYSGEKPVLKDFSITIQPGEKVGIVGLSGAGKTTFANLLLRFFDPQEGSILLDDIDTREFTQEFLRSHISYISQDTSLFHASIAENIAYGSPYASRENIEKAAQLAYADDFIQTLPNGYESIVGERGIKLSGGQRQRIAIARAILANRPFFLLDEATSALDSDSETKIQKGLAKLMENKTVIAIAHRLSTLSNLDRIIFLENGQIVEEGTHDQLLSKNGKYAALWNLQAGGFLPSVL